jgi:RNA polymerase sigma-B factor
METSGSSTTDEELFEELSRTGRRRVRNLLVERHMGFAHHIARRFRGRGIADEDLNQIALLALVKSVDRFEPTYGFAFTAFAGRTIEGEIKRHFRDAGWAVRVPRSAQELHLAVRKATDELRQKLGRSPTAKDVAAHLELSIDDVVTALAAAAVYASSSLDAPVGADGSLTAERSAHLASTHERLEAVPDRVQVERLIAALPHREQEIVRLRFFSQLSQSEIAERVGVSQMHVSRLLRRSFEAMRLAAEPEV